MYSFIVLIFQNNFKLSAGAVDESGQMPYYAEQCASMLAVTFSSGAANKRNIVSQLILRYVWFLRPVIFPDLRI